MKLCIAVALCWLLCGCVAYSTKENGILTVKGFGLDVSIYPEIGIRVGFFEHSTAYAE